MESESGKLLISVGSSPIGRRRFIGRLAKHALIGLIFAQSSIGIPPAKASMNQVHKVPAPVLGASSSGGQPNLIGPLLWNDEFNRREHSEVDPTFWTPNIGTYSQSLPTINSPDLVNFDGSTEGHLLIKTKKIEFPSLYTGLCAGGRPCDFATGEISTRNKLIFRYGYLECRVKMPTGIGNFPALWMLPDGNYGQSSQITPGEIDIFEWGGNNPSRVKSTLLFDSKRGPQGSNSQFLSATGESRTPLSVDYHTIGMSWEPGSIGFYLDNVLEKSFHTTDADTWPFEQYFYLILNGNVAHQPNTDLGGTWDGWKFSILSIDWIRLWKFNGYGSVGIKSNPTGPAFPYISRH